MNREKRLSIYNKATLACNMGVVAGFLTMVSSIPLSIVWAPERPEIVNRYENVVHLNYYFQHLQEIAIDIPEIRSTNPDLEGQIQEMQGGLTNELSDIIETLDASIDSMQSDPGYIEYNASFDRTTKKVLGVLCSGGGLGIISSLGLIYAGWRERRETKVSDEK